MGRVKFVFVLAGAMFLCGTCVFAQTAEEVMSKGIALQQVRDYKGAVAYFTEAIKLNPSYKEAYFGRGVCYAN